MNRITTDSLKHWNIHSFICSLSIVLLMLHVAGTWLPATAQATRYVSINGVNTSSCTSQSNPCSTITHAITISAPGDTIRIGPGIYTERFTINKSITLRGNGNQIPGATIIQASNQQSQATGRVISISGGFVVDISDMVIRHGRQVNGAHPYGLGGGILSSGANLTLRNVTFSNNRADFGGGLYVSTGTAKLNNIEFNGNQADLDGGGMYNEFVKTLITDVTFSGNSAASNGGGLYNYTTSAPNSPELLRVSFINNSASSGGGMVNTGASTLEEVVFTGNSAVTGGGMFAVQQAATLTHVEFIENTASQRGGGMHLSSSSPQLTHVTFLGNNGGIHGGGLSTSSSSSPFMRHVEFVGNNAYYGGGVYNQNNSSPTLFGAFLRDNTSTYGGGLYSQGNSAPSLSDVILEGNHAVNMGGGMYTENANPLLAVVEFNNNTANLGAGMYNDKSNPVLYNVFFNSNTASNSAGGLANQSSSPVLTNVVFWGNQAIDNFGGAVWNMNNSKPKLRNVTITNNHAGKNGGGMVNYLASAPEVYNSIIWGNTAGESGNEIYISAGGIASTVALFYSLHGNGRDDVAGSGFGCIECIAGQNPQFVDVEGFDLRLQDRSPAIDAGDPETDPTIFPLNFDEERIDIAFNPRFYNGRIDMGAYEYTGPTTSITELDDVPASFELLQNYPNPFNPSTDIRFSLPEHAMVTLTVYDITGRRIVTLVSQPMAPGTHTVRFDAGTLAGGVYIYRLVAGSESRTEKMLLVK